MRGDHLRNSADPHKICERLINEINRLGRFCSSAEQKEAHQVMFDCAVYIKNTLPNQPSASSASDQAPTLTASS